MRNWEIVWRDYLGNTVRNVVNEDPRPTNIQAKEWNYSAPNENGDVIGINFTNEEDEVIMTLFEFPLLIKLASG